MKENHAKAVVSTGIVSLVTFFTVMLLASFSVLILISARSDAELSGKAADSLSEYYLADSKSEEKLAELQNLCSNTSYEELESVLVQNGFNVYTLDGYDGLIVNYDTEISDLKYLSAEIFIPVADKDSPQKITWKIILT